MANQNFRVKKGLEVGLGATFLYADDTGVGINSSAPRYNLDVQGTANIKDGVIIGEPATQVVGLGSTVFQVEGNSYFDGDVFITGDINFDDANVENLNVTGIATINQLKFGVGVGSTLTVGILSVTEDIKVNGSGIATIGGDPSFNSLTVTGFSTFGGLNTTGFSTFYQNVRIEEDLEVGGNIKLLDLNAGNITVGGTVTTNGLEFNSGIGTELVVGVASVGVLTGRELNITGFATFGGLNTTGFSTFYQNLEVKSDLKVGGNIKLEDLNAGNITIGGTMTSNGLKFNVGIGTTLTLETLNVTGISSLNIITGIGSELQYLPAGSISTSVGVGSTQPPTLRPTGEPVQPGDLWFDSDGLRQYTYYVQAGVQTGIWVDSNPPPIQPDFKFRGDEGPLSSFDIQDDFFNIIGISSQIITRVPLVGFGQTIFIGLTTDVYIEGDLEVGDLVKSTNANISGIATIGILSANSANIGSLNVDNITVDDITVQEVGINTLNFNVGIGTTLTVTDLSVNGTANIGGAGIATVGGAVTFSSLSVSGITTLGVTTITENLFIEKNLTVVGDITLDEANLRNINVTGLSTFTQIGFTTGIGTSLNITDKVSVGGTFNVVEQSTLDDVRVGGALTVVGLSTFGNNVFINGKLDISGDFDADEIDARNITALEKLIANDSLSFVVGSGTTLTVNSKLTSKNLADFQTIGISSALNVTGVSSFTDNIGFGTANGYELNVDRLRVPSDGFVDLPGIPVVGGAASFSQLIVTGISSFNGFTTITGDVAVSGAMTVGSLTAETINFSGGTGIGSDTISTRFLNVTGLSTLGIATAESIIVGGASTFIGVGTFQNDLYVSNDLFVSRSVGIGSTLTVGVVSANTINANNLTVTGVLSAAPGGQIIVEGDSSITGVVTIGGNSITLDGRQGQEYIEVGTGSGVRIAGLNTFTGERSYVRVDEGRFDNFISVTGIGSTSSFTNDVSIGGKLTVKGDITLDGQVVGVTTFANLNVTGVATVGFLTATNAQVSGMITAQDFNSLSDKRVKEDIRIIDDPLGKVSRLNGVTYKFVNSGKPSVGVIAQEVERVFPELIAGTFPKSVNYNGLVGLLIESVKELKDQNEELKRRLDKLEG